ncbi:uncharacterized protein LOC125950234 [Anopheles darlingi]|uniref:uncharacterized protein LOC125950234 n=1 Tax=Anopheles darlingi TaxID=43151 RepID=UPI00210006F5|nr:uncharacterized protein LOC125950234 [Anopheles darlingi]
MSSHTLRFEPLCFDLALRCSFLPLLFSRTIRGSDDAAGASADLKAAAAFVAAASRRLTVSVAHASAWPCCSEFHSCCSTLRISRQAWLMFRQCCSSFSSVSCSVSAVTGSSVPYASSLTRTSLKRGQSNIACSTESTTSWPGHLVQFGDRLTTFGMTRRAHFTYRLAPGSVAALSHSLCHRWIVAARSSFRIAPLGRLSSLDLLWQRTSSSSNRRMGGSEANTLAV